MYSKMNNKKAIFLFSIFFSSFLVVSELCAQSLIPSQSESPSVSPPLVTRNLVSVPLFPAAYQSDYLIGQKATFSVKPYWAPTKAEVENARNHYIENTSILLNSDILAFYGHPNSKNMGILGRFTKDELYQKLDALAAQYRAVSGGRDVKKAFYIIYGTAWPKGEIGIINEKTLKSYIEYAQQHDMLVFLDHQIGKFEPVDCLKRMLPWLKYPNVQLALDPEWRTTKPMEEIGTVTAQEVNDCEQAMENYIVQNNISGERLLVIHQFNWCMISHRDQVRSNFRHVRLIHCADGFGPPHLKRDTYAFNAAATNMPIKGFKLFYDFKIPGAGVDKPLLTPAQVFSLKPRPYLVMYQ
jgi:hypothetical protein